MLLMDWVSGRVFHFVHGNNLVYNTCWEDPRLDRVALELDSEQEVLVITSAGCNALDYALVGPRHVYAVDMNPRQNALLELKLSAVRHLEFEDFFRMFGEGRIPRARRVYEQQLRAGLSSWSQGYWDKFIGFFDNPKRSFFYRGTAGSFARMINVYVTRVLHARKYVDAILDAQSIEEQVEIYERHLRDRFWSKSLRFAMNRDTTLSMLGVPKAQRRQVEKHYEGGIVKFMQDCVEAVFTKLPLSDNYFWRVYITGHYTRGCCPEYLKPENYLKLRDGLVDRISVHTASVQNFLEKHPTPISRFVLLDHQDWLADRFFPLLEAEWQAIVDRAAPGTRVLWRSGGLRTEFLDDVQVRIRGQLRPLPELLTFHEQLAAELHARDRVHTYGSFYIADLAA